jgi:hypothetical protein
MGLSQYINCRNIAITLSGDSTFFKHVFVLRVSDG